METPPNTTSSLRLAAKRPGLDHPVPTEWFCEDRGTATCKAATSNTASLTLWAMSVLFSSVSWPVGRAARLQGTLSMLKAAPGTLFQCGQALPQPLTQLPSALHHVVFNEFI